MSKSDLTISKPRPYAVVFKCSDLRIEDDVKNLLCGVFRKSSEQIHELSLQLFNKGKVEVQTYPCRDTANTKALQAIDYMRKESKHTSMSIDIQMK